MSLRGLAVGAAVALCACGRGGTNVSGTRVARDDGAPDCDRVTIRLLGTAARDVTTLRLALASLDARDTSSGERVRVDDVACGRTLDVSTDLIAYTLGTMPFRRDGDHVEITLGFSGGHACKGDADGDIAGCLAPLSFDFDPGRVHPARCQVEVLLDVGRSVVTSDDGLTFLPNLRVVY